ncbi:uncharacterized protein HMPREF1541_05913 [Cyphellophora europaea CBS 101466]|uniref:Zn(2)-C6 fungal-type domain-containing protein n=1 Tax=Cyphellophora europaea (strain CBS 101466) TaxID=1220924 RepID=W2RTA2_CYPE1|nr:uncharacterized protein HMPREF1541_05913 [Cyphellophora europaea CBS 101466]ETN39687.1 hypothetical protein HMPREF1541_05913 [Cyphellophora europaea CBS 101466]
MSVKRPREDDEDQPFLSQLGDRPPKTRLTRACAECKKHKIKCEVQAGQTACNKCLRSGIECVPFNFAQKFIDDDAQWKAEAAAEREQLKSAVQYLLRHSQLPELAAFANGQAPPTPSGPATSRSLVDPPTDLSGVATTESAPEDNGLVTAPMRILHSLTQNGALQPVRSAEHDPRDSDFIAQGHVSITEAEYLFTQYRTRLNTLLWAGVLCPHPDLEQSRQSSALLTAAVLTVAALHTPGREQSFHACYEIFTALIRDASMSRSQSLDDIRGLCIGAFYINSLSWRLCGLAIRMATEMNLHMAFRDLVQGHTEARTLVQLWYVLYICDHQFSIAHGRPPIMFNDAAIRGVDKFLAGPDATDGDIRLSAQLSLWPILTEAYVLYGTDPELELSDSDYEKLRSFSIAVDQWRTSWRLRSVDMPVYGAYPSKGVVLYYHFALFQLNSLSLRGISTIPGQNASGVNLSWDRREAANVAINSARSTLRLIVEDQDLRLALVGVPIFTHTMIAMCATFLVKLAVAFAASDPATTFKTRLVIPKDLSSLGLTFATANVLSLVTDLTRVLDEMTQQVGRMHLANHINSGIKTLLRRFSPPNAAGEYRYMLPLDAEDIRMAVAIPSTSEARHFDGGLHRSENGVPETLPAMPPPSSNTNERDLGPMLGTFDWKFDEDFLWPANTDDPGSWFTEQFPQA